MVLIEKFCYQIGTLIADVVLLSSAPISLIGVSKVSKGWAKFSALANRVSLNDKSPEGLTKNIFNCLESFNY